MTTIASTFTKLATDSSVSDSDQVWRVDKAERIGAGIYACAGEAADAEKFLTWIRRGRRGKRPEMQDGFDALALTPEGLFLYDKNLVPMKLRDEHAIGSGGKVARAVLMCGKTVEEAVEIACQIDAGSRGPVQVYELNPKGVS